MPYLTFENCLYSSMAAGSICGAIMGAKASTDLPCSNPIEKFGTMMGLSLMGSIGGMVAGMLSPITAPAAMYYFLSK